MTFTFVIEGGLFVEVQRTQEKAEQSVFNGSGFVKDCFSRHLVPPSQ